MIGRGPVTSFWGKDNGIRALGKCPKPRWQADRLLLANNTTTLRNLAAAGLEEVIARGMI